MFQLICSHMVTCNLFKGTLVNSFLVRQTWRRQDWRMEIKRTCQNLEIHVVDTQPLAFGNIIHLRAAEHLLKMLLNSHNIKFGKKLFQQIYGPQFDPTTGPKLIALIQVCTNPFSGKALAIYNQRTVLTTTNSQVHPTTT